MIAVLLAALLAAGPAPAAPSAAGTVLPIRRFALVAGVNDGGPDRVRLRYARSDAERVARVLQRLGGVAPPDAILLLDADEAALRQAFQSMETRVREARASHRAELVLYYSGHSDEQGLLLRGTRVAYADVRRFLEAVGAEVRIAIVDSCSSGALTREKGGQRAPPFLVDTSTAVKGHAILTSSAANEASQESDRIGASFFTHFLLTGLRGAADASLDGKVTVSEAYQFAFSETLARTERTRSGAQHPAYDIQLVGSGDVVLTDLRGTDATLVFPEAASGRFFVRDQENRLVAELRKPAGRPVQLGVDAGSYRVLREEGDRLTHAEVAVQSGANAPVPVERLAPVPREMTALRGGDIAYVRVDLSIFPPISLNGDRATVNRLQLGLIASRTTRLRGLGLAPVLWAEEDVVGLQFASVGASARGSVRGAQIASVANVAGELRGVQISPILNLVRSETAGLQHAWFANWTGGLVRGAQIAEIMNVAGSVRGAQLGGVNVAREVHGVQCCGVNVATGPAVRGWQVGIVNVSRRVDGIPLGLVNVVRDGWRRILAVADEDGAPAVAYAGGNAFFHTTLEASIRRTAGGVRGWAGFGPGVHLWRGRLGLDVDLLGRHELDEVDPYVVLTLRGLAAVRVSPRLAIVAGPTGNVLLARDPKSAPRIGGALGDGAPFGEGARMWAGLQLGARL